MSDGHTDFRGSYPRNNRLVQKTPLAKDVKGIILYENDSVWLAEEDGTFFEANLLSVDLETLEVTLLTKSNSYLTLGFVAKKNVPLQTFSWLLKA